MLPPQIIVPGEQIVARQCHTMSVLRQYLVVHGGIHSSGQAQPLLLSDTMVSSKMPDACACMVCLVNDQGGRVHAKVVQQPWPAYSFAGWWCFCVLQAAVQC